MSLGQRPVEERRELVSTFSLSLHVRQHLRYEKQRRCIDKELISEAIENGDREDNPKSEADTAIFYTLSGITFLVAVDTISEKVVTAYPIEIDRRLAILSNRWTQPQINSVQERVEEGKTEMI